MRFELEFAVCAGDRDEQETHSPLSLVNYEPLFLAEDRLSCQEQVGVIRLLVGNY